MLDSTLKLGEMTKGFKGRVTGIEAKKNEQDNHMSDHLRELGFSEGLSVELLHHSPFGRDPIAVKIGSMTIALRRKQANHIIVETV